MSRFYVILVLTLSLSLNVLAKFPVDPQPCKYGDVDCLTKAIEYFVREKNQGDNSINLIKIDPLEVKSIHINQGAESAVNIDLLFSNNNIYGLKDTKVIKISGFGKDMTQKHELTVRTNAINLVGDYKVNGKILLLPIVGSGTSNITLLNTDLIMRFTGVPFEKDGATYMKIDKLHFDIEPKQIIFKIDNLFNGDKILGDNMNFFLNENWEDIYREIRGSITEAFGKIFHSIINHVFAKYPYDKFFAE